MPTPQRMRIKMLVKVRRFESFDLPLVQEWLSQRGVKVKDEEFPGYGWICFIRDEPVATMFLRRCDHIGFIEGITTNPNQETLPRHLALDNLYLTVTNWAKENGIKNLIGYSIDYGMIQRAEKWGFKNTNQTLMSLKLGE